MARNYRTGVMLLGGFYCHLLDSERNEWGEYVHAHLVYAKHVELAINADALEAAVNGGATQLLDALKAAMSEYQISKRALFEVGKEWHAEVIAPRIAAEGRQ